MRTPNSTPHHALVAAVVAALTLLTLPAAASAHAVLKHSEPHRWATVQAGPAEVVIEFNEPVEADFGSVRVFDAESERVDEGEPRYSRGNRRRVSIALRDGLPKGVYTATYRVVSADGHPVSGGFAFGIGVAASSGDPPSVADLLGESDAGPAVEIAYGVVRGLHYAALLLMIGALAFRVLVWRGAAGWPGRLLLGAALTGLVTATAGFPLQGLVAAGAGFGDLDPTVLEVSYDSRTGFAWAGRAVVWLGLAALLLALRPPDRLRILALAAGTLLLVLSLPYGGHARTQSPAGVLVPADVVHVTAAGVWLGGLVLLLVAFWPRRASLAAGATAGLAPAADATRRFSRLALPAVAVLLLAGLVQAWFYLGSPGELLGGSAYALALLAKLALLGVIAGLAFANRRRAARLVPDGPAGALRRAMRAEVALALLVLAATAVLVREAPPEAAATGPVTEELDIGPLRLELVVEPAEAGPNDMHLYLFERETGEQVDRVDGLTVRLRHDGTDRTVAIRRKGPAHYEQLDLPLDHDGNWDVTVTLRSGGTHTARTEIEVRKK